MHVYVFYKKTVYNDFCKHFNRFLISTFLDIHRQSYSPSKVTKREDNEIKNKITNFGGICTKKVVFKFQPLPSFPFS